MARARWVGGALAAVAAALALGPAARAAFIPWDPLAVDIWIYTGAPGQTRILMYTVNGGTYEVGFDQAASGNRSRGMNALKFSYGGASEGHLATGSLAGSFQVLNTGNARTFADLVVVASIRASSLPADFAMALGVAGRPMYAFDPAADFAYQDAAAGDTGRPSGYYSLTSPPREGVAYSFERGLVTAFAAEGVALGPNGGSVTFDYAFTHLPGPCVFSVYGLDAAVGWVYHTNRAITDLNQPSAPVSTFEVAPEPATLLLVAGGAALAAAGKRRWPRPAP